MSTKRFLKLFLAPMLVLGLILIGAYADTLTVAGDGDGGRRLLIENLVPGDLK
jgi:hypothetical protein